MKFRNSANLTNLFRKVARDKKRITGQRFLLIAQKRKLFGTNTSLKEKKNKT
jgi:hypothetical protein